MFLVYVALLLDHVAPPLDYVALPLDYLSHFLVYLAAPQHVGYLILRFVYLGAQYLLVGKMTFQGPTGPKNPYIPMGMGGAEQAGRPNVVYLYCNHG